MKMRRERIKTGRSLVATLAIAFLALSVVGLLISGGAQLFFNIQTQRETIASGQQLIAREASNQVSSFIQDKFGALETSIRLVDPVAASAETQKQILDSLLGLQPAFRELMLLDAQNQPLAYSSRLSLMPSGQLTAQLTDNTLVSSPQVGRYISPIYIEEITNEPLVVLAVPVTNALGDFQGTLAAEVNLKFMWDLVDQLRVGETGWVYVVDRQGTLIAFRETDRVLKGENVRNIAKVAEFISIPESSDTTAGEFYTGIRGTTVVGTFIALGTPDWAVVIEMPWQEAYHGVIQNSEVAGGITLVMAIVVGLAGAYLARRLAVPLVNLTRTATRIAAGETELRAAVRGPNEIAGLAAAFNSMTQQLRNLISGLEQRVEERTYDLERRSTYLEATARVAREASATLNMVDLLPRIATLISDQFGFYHTGIFLLDATGRWAELRAVSSAGGQRMLQRGHRLRVEDQGVVGYAASRGEARVVLDTDTDAIFLHNPDLPDTHSEMALPLRARGQIIGVLDVQSTVSQAFSEEDVAVLQTLADQVALAISNAQLFAQTEESLDAERRAYGELSRQAWSQLIGRAALGFVSDEHGVSPVVDALEPQKQEALLDGQVAVTGGDAAMLSVPIRVRGQVIGVVDVQQPGDTGGNADQWAPEQISMVQTLADQVGVALESARLYQDTRQRAAREQLVGEVTSRIRQSLDMETILRTATSELREALNLNGVVIRLAAPKTEGNPD